MAGLFLHRRFSDFYLQKYPLKKINQPSGKEICCRGKKSKEIVGNWNQRFPDTKALISIVNFGKGSE